MAHKEAFLVYTSFYKPISLLSDKQLGRLFRAVFQYNLGEVVSVEDDIRMAFEFFKNQFEIDESKYQAKINRDIENGRKGGNPNFKRGQPNPYRQKEKPGITQDNPPLSGITQDKAINDKDNDNDNKETSLTRGKESGAATATPTSATGMAEAFKPKQTEPQTDKTPVKEIMDMWNGICASYPKLIKISDSRRNKIRNRIEEMGGKENALPVLKQIFEIMQKSEFLKGDNRRGWKASFDWVFENDKNWVKVWEGNYENRQEAASSDIGVVLRDNSPDKYETEQEKKWEERWKR